MNSCFRIRFTASRWLLLALLLGFMVAPAAAKPPKMRDLADTMDNNPILTQFAAMVRAADLGTFLSSRGPFTVFAPTDSAFARLPPGVLQSLLQPQNKERLADIVLFHVVNGKRLTAKDLFPLKSILSCQGSPLNLKTSRTGTQFVMKAKITHADIRCQNGIINQIDTVLMPPESALPPLAPLPAPVVAAPASNTVTPITNVAPADTNAAIPVAPVAMPDASPH